jgi:hypothetical protein
MCELFLISIPSPGKTAFCRQLENRIEAAYLNAAQTMACNRMDVGASSICCDLLSPSVIFRAECCFIKFA